MRIARIHASGSAGAALTFLICAMAGTAAGQWLSIPLPGTPRTPDGKPNLNAATPSTAGASEVLKADAAYREAVLGSDIQTLTAIMREDIVIMRSDGTADNRANFLDSFTSGRLKIRL